MDPQVRLTKRQSSRWTGAPLMELTGLGDDPLHLDADRPLRAAAPQVTVAQFDVGFVDALADRWADTPNVHVVDRL